MDASMAGIRLTTAVMGPLLRKLLRTEGPGAGLVDRPVRIAPHVSLREKRVLDRDDLRRLADTAVEEALRTPGERPVPPGEEAGVAAALATTLQALGDITLTDLQAVHLGHEALARQLRAAAPEPVLGRDALLFHDRLLTATCLHVLNFFTQRATFVPAALVEQTRLIARLIAIMDAARPDPAGADAAFERDYLAYTATRHGTLTIFGLDLAPDAARWPLDVAYLSLEAASGTGEGLRTAPADEVLTRGERALLRGEAGSGKTTLVQWLAVSAARGGQGGRIPYVLPLRTLTRHGERLPAPGDFLGSAGSPLAGAQPPGWEARVLRDRRALMLVDGLDEIPEPERARARDWLARLLAAYPGNRWLVTSRPSAVRQDWLAGEGFDELTLSPMNRAEVAGFVERWHRAAGAPDADGAQLLAAVRAKPDLDRLATNPLLCGLICALHRERRGFLPSGRKELYTAALSMLLYRRDIERDLLLPDLAEEPQLQLLQRLAYWLIRNGHTELDRQQARELLEKALPSVPAAAAALGGASDVLRHFVNRTGLLRAPTEDTVEFVHRTFQDFLGARAALDDVSFGELAAHCEDDQWEDVIRLAVAQGRPRDRAEILRALLSRNTDRSALLALASLEGAPELDPAIRTDVEQQAARLVPPADIEAARALGAVGPLVLDLLPGPEGAATDREAHLSVVAAGAVGSDLAIPFLARYRAHPSEHLRDTLVQLWSMFDSRRYAAEVIAGLDPPPERVTVRSDAQLEALVGLGVRELRATGELSHRALTACLEQIQIEGLTLENNPGLTDVDFLGGQRSLKRVEIAHCGALRDLSGLHGLPVEDAVLILTGSLSLDAVTRSWPALHSLTLTGSYAEWSLDSLAPGVSLVTLQLTRPTPSLRGLVRHPRLSDLWLAGTPGPADWEAIGRLEHLRHLALPASALGSIPDSLRMPAVRGLALTAPERMRVPAYSDVAARHFPNANLD
ncbi:NACHT domain-containing protein [Streptomyces sp. NPDC059564]|uniref:NACHT domain-containing protein n=1 Tax=Streptomyces sp. NPDC059564 TaxID=3346865 RepID=UPI0036CDFEEA